MKIVIPLDGSLFAEAVLEPASKLWASPRDEVHLVEVVNDPGRVDTAEQYLDKIAVGLPNFDILKNVVVSDDPAKAIIDYAWRNNIDLIALSTHGRTGRKRMMMGSVAGEILQARVAPLFMIRPEGLIYAAADAGH